MKMCINFINWLIKPNWYESTLGMDEKPVIVLKQGTWNTTIHQCQIDWIIETLQEFKKRGKLP